MTAERFPLTDELLKRALIELAAGPEAFDLVTDVVRETRTTRQAGRFGLPALGLGRWGLLAAVALLSVVVAASLFGIGQMQPLPVPTSSPSPSPSPTLRAPSVPSIVVQNSSTERGDAFTVSHTVYAPNSTDGVPLVSGLPDNAIGLRWSPDGLHMVYAIREAPLQSRGYSQPSIFVADGDGANPKRLNLLHAANWYASHQWWAGAVWAPTSNLFALPWDSGSCTGGPDCMPPTGIDVFDLSGARVAALDTPDTMSPDVTWSPDAGAVGWHSGVCIQSTCSNHAFNWQPLADSSSVTTLPSLHDISVDWAPDDRLRVVTSDDAGAVKEVYSTKPDGSDVTTYPWESAATPVWSPNGDLLAAVDNATSRLIVRNVVVGSDVSIVVPTNLGLAAWSPESDRVALYGDPKSDGGDYAFYVVKVDGSGDVSYVADGEDFAWLPPSAAPNSAKPPQ